MIRFVQIFGERWSGTNYLASLIELNFKSAKLTRAFGGKHWYLKEHHPRCAPNNSTDFQCVRSLDQSDDTLFLVIVRNPFDWLRSMTVNPYHATNHLDLPFAEFIRKPWIAFEHHRVNPTWPPAEDNYYFIESAENLLKLRSMKIGHWLNLTERVSQIAIINYEKLHDDIGLLHDIAVTHNVFLAEDSMSNELRYCVGAGIQDRSFVPRRRFAIEAQDLDFVRTELDWSLENAVGYDKADYEFDP